MEQPKLLKELGMLFPKPTSKRKVRYGEYKCPECSKAFKAICASINNGHTKSCGCLRTKKKESLFIVPKEDLTVKLLKAELTYDALTGKFNRKYGKQISEKLTSSGYYTITVAGTPYLAHRLAWFYTYGYFPTMIDHIDGNRVNNCINNLREVAALDNQRNLSKAINNTSGTTGVSYSKSSNKWEAKIQVKGKTIHLGRFLDLEDAILARKQGEIDYGFHANHGKTKL